MENTLEYCVCSKFNQLNFDIEKFAVFSWQICGFSSCAVCRYCAHSPRQVQIIFLIFLWFFLSVRLFIAGKYHKQNNVNGAFFRICDGVRISACETNVISLIILVFMMSFSLNWIVVLTLAFKLPTETKRQMYRATNIYNLGEGLVGCYNEKREYEIDILWVFFVLFLNGTCLIWISFEEQNQSYEFFWIWNIWFEWFCIHLLDLPSIWYCDHYIWLMHTIRIEKLLIYTCMQITPFLLFYFGTFSFQSSYSGLYIVHPSICWLISILC